MPNRVKPNRDQFKFEGDDLVHTPTGARWWFSGGKLMNRKSKLGSVLPNGDDYREDEVGDMAQQILKKKIADSE